MHDSGNISIVPEAYTLDADSKKVEARTARRLEANSFQPVLSKVFGTLLLYQLKEYCAIRKLISDDQSGFLAGHVASRTW